MTIAMIFLKMHQMKIILEKGGKFEFAKLLEKQRGLQKILA